MAYADLRLRRVRFRDHTCDANERRSIHRARHRGSDTALPVTEQRVREIRLQNGALVNDTATYSVTVSDFMASGGDGYSMFARAQASRATGVIDLDALIEYLQAMPQPVQPPRDVRLQASPRR